MEQTHWLIKQALKKPSQQYDRNSSQLYTQIHTINTTNGRSKPGAAAENQSRKTNILTNEGHEIGRKYGLPPNDRTGTHYRKELETREETDNEPKNDTPEQHTQTQQYKDSNEDNITNKTTYYGEREITVETAIYSQRNLRKYYNLKRHIITAIKRLGKRNLNSTQVIQEYARQEQHESSGENLILEEGLSVGWQHLLNRKEIIQKKTFEEGITSIIHFMFSEVNTIIAKIRKIATWNTGGFTEQAQSIYENISKGRVAKIVALTYRVGIVLWQETGMTDALAATIQQYDPNIVIVHTPPNNVYPYGSAILWPRHKFGDPMWMCTIVPGCIIAAALNTGDGPAVIMSAYMPRSKLTECADSIKQFLPHIRNYPTAILGGDFNYRSGKTGYEDGILYTMAINGLKASNGEQPNPKFTYRDGQKYTRLDEIFIKHPVLHTELTMLSTRTFYNLRTVQEHAQLLCTITSKGYEDKTNFPKYELTRLDKLHPASRETPAIIQKINDEVFGPHPNQVQAQIAAIAHAQSLRLEQINSVDPEQRNYRANQHWLSIKQKIRHAKGDIVNIKKEAIEDLNQKIRSTTQTNGQHDICSDKPPDPCGLIQCSKAWLAYKIAMLENAISQKKAIDDYIFKPNATLYNQRIIQRPKEKTGKFDGQLQALYKRIGGHDSPHGEDLTTSISELERTVRANRPHLSEGINEDVPELTEEQTRFLEWYQDNAPPAPDIRRPTQEIFAKRIAFSNNSGMGTDRVPNAFYRTNPRTFAGILEWEVEYRECNPENPNPVPQLLSWIPKANAGMTDDCWRPLSVPTTYNRHLTGGVTDWITIEWQEALDHRQTLAGDFKEAHANYRAAQNHLSEQIGHQNNDDPIASVLFTDLVKAFELLNPKWIRGVLKARKAPRWLENIIECFIGHRTATAKIMGRLIRTVNVNIGVDMGNALAPWIFCIALDPLIRYANRIPDVVAMRAYMDDTNTATIGTQAIKRTQAMWEIMGEAGLIVAKHTCIKVEHAGEYHRGASLSQILQKIQQDHEGDQQVLINQQTHQISDILTEEGLCTAKIAREIQNWPCTCKGVKTKLLLRRIPNTADLQALDNTPYGLKIIADTDRCLGITAFAPCKTNGRGKETKINENAAAELAYEPYLKKIEIRANRCSYEGGVVHSKLIDWNQFTMSKILYVASQYPPTPKIIRRLTEAQLQTLNIKGIIKREKILSTLKAIGITTARPIKSILKLTIIKAAIRQHGQVAIVAEGTDLQTRAALKAFQEIKFENISPDAREAFTNRTHGKRPREINNMLNETMQHIDTTEAMQEAKEALQIHNQKWCVDNDNLDEVFKHFQEAKLKLITFAQRMSWLRIFTKHDIDDWKRALATNKPKPRKNEECGECGAQGPLFYPEGILEKACCPLHYHFNKGKEIQGDIATKIGEPAAHNDNPLTNIHKSAEFGIRKCPLCHTRENTIRHLIHECPIVEACCKIVKAPPLTEAFNPSCQTLDFARTVCMLHQIRLIMYRKKAFGVMQHRTIDNQQTQKQNLEEILRAYARFAHPSLLACTTLSRALQRTGNTHMQKNHGLLAVKAPAEFGFVKAGKPILAAEKEFQAGEALFSAKTASNTIPTLNGLDPPLPSPIPNLKGNAQWKYTEKDDEIIYELYATMDIPLFGAIIVESQDPYIPEGNRIIGRFDGSCKGPTGNKACGAGIVIYVAQNDIVLTEILTVVIPLPTATDSMQAEAIGAIKTAAEIINLKKLPKYKHLKPLIQGDNKPVILYNSGKSRLNNLRFFDLFQPLFNKIHQAGINIPWQHIPREHNPVADKLANEGADAVSDGTYHTRTDIEGHIVRPGSTTVFSPFAAYEGKGAKPLPVDAAIEYLRELTSGIKPEGELILPEAYSANPADIPANLPDKDALAVLRFLRQRQTLAKYEASKGHCPLSRHFCKNGGIVGGGATKRARYIILSEHFEIDIVACFHTIIRAFSKTLNNPILQSLEETGDFIKENLQGNGNKTKAAKTIIQRIVTTSPQAIVHLARNEFGLEIKPELILHLHRFWNLQRPHITQQMKKAGFIGSEDKEKINKTNMLYFPCEAAETKIMAGAMKRILEENKLKSIIWLHDGMYINKEVPTEKAIQAIVSAAEECGISNIKTKVIDCGNEIVNQAYQPENPCNRALAYEAAIEADNNKREGIGIVNSADKPLGRIKPVLKKPRKLNLSTLF